MVTHSEKPLTIRLRLHPAQRLLIERAATVMQKSLTEFISDAACQMAESVLLDQRHFFLNPADYEAFEQQLEAPLSAAGRIF